MVDIFVLSAVTAVYLIIILFLGYLGWKQTKGTDDFMLAGRKVSPALIALSYGATFISTSAIVGFGGMAAKLGMGLIWLTALNIGLGILIAFIIYGKRTREIGQKLNAVTFPDLMAKRFNSPFMQYSTGLIILLGMPLYTSAVMIGGARFVESTFGISFTTALLAFAAITVLYVLFGGLIAVIYTDAFQGCIMLVGMVLLLYFAYAACGGLGANQVLSDLASQVSSTSLTGLQAQGFTGWTSMPVLGSPLWLTMITTIVMGVGIGVLAQPQLVVRFMAAKDGRSLNRAVPVGGIFILAMTGIAFTVGALTNVYFFQKGGKIAIDSVAGGNVDLIIPTFINLATPDWFVVLFMVTLLAAAMSTLSSLFHTMGTAIGHDILKFTKGYKPSLNKNRIGILIMFAVSVLLALIMPTSIIARATAMFMGLCASAFLAAYTYGIFSKNPSKKAAVTSVISGTVVWILYTVFVHKAESDPLMICNLIFHQPSLLGAPWSVTDPLIFALPVSIIALVAVLAIEMLSQSKEKATEIKIAET